MKISYSSDVNLRTPSDSMNANLPEISNYEYDKKQCCNRVTYFLRLLSDERRKVKGYTDRLQTLHSKVLILDAQGNPIPKGDDECRIVSRILLVPGYKFTHMYLYTCPVSGIRNSPVTMSVYKLIALLELEKDDPRILEALGKFSHASRLHLATSHLVLRLTFKQETSFKHPTCATLGLVSTSGTFS
jgi:hypothetical protein